MIQQNKSLGTRLAKLSGPKGYHSWNFPLIVLVCEGFQYVLEVNLSYE